MADEAKDTIYTAREIFKEARSSSTKGRNFRWVVYTIDGKTYGFFHASDQVNDVSKIRDLNPGDKFIAHYSEKMFNEKMYYTLEEVEITERDVNADVKPTAAPGAAPSASQSDFPADLRVRRAACDVAAVVFPAIRPDWTTPGVSLGLFIVMARGIAEYIAKGDEIDFESIKEVDTFLAEMREGGAGEDRPDPEGEKDREPEKPVENDFPPDEGENDPEGEFPPEDESEEPQETKEEKAEPKKEGTRARRTSTKSS